MSVSASTLSSGNILFSPLALLGQVSVRDSMYAFMTIEELFAQTLIGDWDDERAGVILHNIRRALGGRTGRVILLERLMAADNAPDFNKVIDLQMLAGPGGRERTEDEFRSLFARAGFALTRIVRTASPLSVIEAELP